MESSKTAFRDIIVFIFVLLIILAILMFIKQYKYSKSTAENRGFANNQEEAVESNSVEELNIEENEELRMFLNNIVYFNARKNKQIPEPAMTTEEDFYEGVKLNIASGLVAEKMFNDGIDFTQVDYEFKREEVNKAVKELVNENISEPIQSESSLLEYNASKDAYIFKEAGDATTSGYVVKIGNQTYADGIYKLILLYAYPSEGDIIDNNIDNYKCYVTSMEIKENENYEYSKYQLLSSLPLPSSSSGVIGDYK